MKKMMAVGLALGALVIALTAQSQPPAEGVERHLANVRQLTSGGENAEAYFSPDGRQLIYQTNPGTPGTCDQIFTMNVDGSNKRQLSKGGRTTCGYFFPDGKSIVYASTHLGSSRMPAAPQFFARVRVADLCGVRHLSRRAGWIESAAPDQHAWLRCRGDDRA